jgi:rubrerythrin
MNVYDFAMKMEEESWLHYEKLAAEVRNDELRRIFNLLAESEREHHEHLTLLKAGTSHDVADSVVLDRITSSVHDLMGNLSHGDILKNDEDGYRHVMNAEEASIKLYEKMADQEPDERTADILRHLAEEERHHLEAIEYIYDFVESPKTHLDWGEFSNLKEY